MSQLIGSILDGKYEIIRLIGEGGMGAVYEATHQLIGRRLAVKFLHPQYATSQEVITRFHREAQAAAKIGHENIIEVTDMGMAPDGSPYIVMEFLEGCDVKDLLEEQGILPIPRAANIMTQALSALQAAHVVGIIHRDLKPENIYLIEKSSRPDYVKLLDFGISKFRAMEGEGAKGLTQTGTVLGTPHYMSPEQARGEQDLTVRSDIYAMGVILYQMMTGHIPFDAPNYNALLIKILTEDPAPPEQLNPDLPMEMIDTIKVSMSRDPGARYADAEEFRRRLLPYLPGSSDLSTQLTSASRTAIREAMYKTQTPLEMAQSGIGAGRSKLPFVIGGAAALVAAVAVGVVLMMGGEPTPAPVVPAVSNEEPEPAVSEAEPAAEEPSEGKVPEGEEAAVLPIVEKISVSISAAPKDAVIEVDGVQVGSNPFEGPFIKDGAMHKIKVSAKGYETEAALESFDKDLQLSYQLEKKKIQTGSSKSKKGKETKGGKPKGVLIVEEKAAPVKATAPKKTKGKKPNRRIDYDDPWNQ